MIATLRHNFWYKLLAVFFALVLHFYAAGLINARPGHLLTVPLAVHNLPPGLTLNENALPSVGLTLDGPTDEIARLSDATVGAWVDLSHARAGETPPLAVHLTGLPADVSVEADPRPITLLLQPRRRRQLPISAADIGIAPAGFAFTAPSITPREAVITGTREAVGAVVRLVAQADPGQSAGAVDDDFTVVALDSAGSPVSDVTVTPPTAHVRMDVVQATARKALVVSPDIVGTPAAPYRFGGIDVSPAVLTAQGRAEQIAPVGTLLTAPVDVTGATADVVRRVAPVAPEGVTLSPRGPVTVTVHIIAPPQLAPLPPANSAGQASPATP